MPRGGKVWRIEFSRSFAEASGGVRNELLNRKSGVRIPAPAPFANFFLVRSRAHLVERVLYRGGAVAQ